jgi:hypothetical protein
MDVQPPIYATQAVRLRVNGLHAVWLLGFGCEVNTVAGYCSELFLTVYQRERRFLSAFGLAVP